MHWLPLRHRIRHIQRQCTTLDCDQACLARLLSRLSFRLVRHMNEECSSSMLVPHLLRNNCRVTPLQEQHACTQRASYPFEAHYTPSRDHIGTIASFKSGSTIVAATIFFSQLRASPQPCSKPPCVLWKHPPQTVDTQGFSLNRNTRPKQYRGLKSVKHLPTLLWGVP